MGLAKTTTSRLSRRGPERLPRRPRPETPGWSEGEDFLLERCLGAGVPTELLTRILNRPVASIEERILARGRDARELGWSRADLARFKRLYGTASDDELAHAFRCTVDDVRRLAHERRLAKDKAWLARTNGKHASRMPRWKTAEVELLRTQYQGLSNLEIAGLLGRSVTSVVSKAHELGLKKSPERLEAMGRENVRVRYEV